MGMKKLCILAGALLAFAACTAQQATTVQPGSNAAPQGNDQIISEARARAIAEASCIKSGETLKPGYYNAGTRTWWFDATLHETRTGCNPACVVSVDSMTAEINWRCTGAGTPNINVGGRNVTP